MSLENALLARIIKKRLRDLLKIVLNNDPDPRNLNIPDLDESARSRIRTRIRNMWYGRYRTVLCNSVPDLWRFGSDPNPRIGTLEYARIRILDPDPALLFSGLQETNKK